jgi:hypothetical protein
MQGLNKTVADKVEEKGTIAVEAEDEKDGAGPLPPLIGGIVVLGLAVGIGYYLKRRQTIKVIVLVRH